MYALRSKSENPTTIKNTPPPRKERQAGLCHVFGHRFIFQELHAVIGPALGNVPQLSDIAEHLLRGGFRLGFSLIFGKAPATSAFLVSLGQFYVLKNKHLPGSCLINSAALLIECFTFQIPFPSSFSCRPKICKHFAACNQHHSH